MDKKPNLKKAAALEDIEEYGEGLYYFFVCEACGAPGGELRSDIMRCLT
jgi:hypothetical protein